MTKRIKSDYKIVNIYRQRRGTNEYIYGDLIDGDGGLCVHATLDYILLRLYVLIAQQEGEA